jgi:hypothetical protein
VVSQRHEAILHLPQLNNNRAGNSRLVEGITMATPDIFDGVLSDFASGKRKSPLAKPATAPAQSEPPAAPKAMVDNFVALLSPLDDAKRAKTIAAFNAAVDQVSNADEQEPVEEPAAQEETESATG